MQQNNAWHSISDLEAAFSATSLSPPQQKSPDDSTNSKNFDKFLPNLSRPVIRPSHYLGELVWQVS